MKRILMLILLIIIVNINVCIKAKECDYSTISGTNMSFITLNEVNLYKEVNSTEVLTTIPEGIELNSKRISGFCDKNYYEIEYNGKKGWILVEISHDNNFVSKDSSLEKIGEKNNSLLTLKDIKVYDTIKQDKTMGNINKYNIYEITFYTVNKEKDKSIAYVKSNNLEGWISFNSKEAIIHHNCNKDCQLYTRYILQEDTQVLNNETNKETKLNKGTVLYKLDNGKYIYDGGLYTIIEKTNETNNNENKSNNLIVPVIVTLSLIVIVLIVIIIVSKSKRKNNK